jgi:hypothetical protein
MTMIGTEAHYKTRNGPRTGIITETKISENSGRKLCLIDSDEACLWVYVSDLLHKCEVCEEEYSCGTLNIGEETISICRACYDNHDSQIDF